MLGSVGVKTNTTVPEVNFVEIPLLSSYVIAYNGKILQMTVICALMQEGRGTKGPFTLSDSFAKKLLKAIVLSMCHGTVESRSLNRS